MIQNVAPRHPYPAIGAEFKLIIDGDARDNQPLALVRRAGFANGCWAHNGSSVEGRQTRPFNLVAINHNTFGVVLDELMHHGRIPLGQWVIGFKAVFPKTDGKGPIGVADASWVGPDGQLYFPCIGRGGDITFHRATGAFGTNWRWLVGVGVNG
jgi:hypothetical protein